MDVTEVTHELRRLADLVRERNRVEKGITSIIGRPASIGHLGEFIAARVFDIQLEASAAHKGSDGRFQAGPLTGRTVNIKWYAKRENILDIRPDALPDFYLVLTGPHQPAMASRGQSRPSVIDAVFLFDAKALILALQASGVKIGIASSVASALWIAAEIYPRANNARSTVTSTQEEQLRFFASTEPR